MPKQKREILNINNNTHGRINSMQNDIQDLKANDKKCRTRTLVKSSLILIPTKWLN